MACQCDGMKYGVSNNAYLSAALGFGDKSIVSFASNHANTNAPVFEIFGIAYEQHPDAKPIFRSDRRKQYALCRDGQEYVRSVSLH